MAAPRHVSALHSWLAWCRDHGLGGVGDVLGDLLGSGAVVQVGVVDADGDPAAAGEAEQARDWCGDRHPLFEARVVRVVCGIVQEALPVVQLAEAEGFFEVVSRADELRGPV